MGPNILLSSCSLVYVFPINIRDHIPRSYKSTGKIIVPYISVLICKVCQKPQNLPANLSGNSGDVKKWAPTQNMTEEEIVIRICSSDVKHTK
jgi:hypothetical protein